MASATDMCRGCGRRFFPGGFSNHLQFSRDPRCISARDHLGPTYPGTTNEDRPGSSSSVIDIEMDDDTEAFIPLEQSNQTDCIDLDTNMSNCEDDSGQDNNRHPLSMLKDTPGLTTLLPGTPAQILLDSDSEDSNSDPDDSDSNPKNPIPDPVPSLPDTEDGSQMSEFVHTALISISDRGPSDFQSQTSSIPGIPAVAQFVKKFSGAGKILEANPLLAGYKPYASSLQTEDNQPLEWAPFSTRLEWEVARWAKLRGPSSTALSELLQINGVSEHILIYDSELNFYFSSFQMHLGYHFQAQRNLIRSLIKNSQLDFHNLFERKLSLQARNMSSITVISSNVSKSSMVIQNLQNLWFMPLNSTIRAQIESVKSSLR